MSRVSRILFPKSLWSFGFTYWWIVSLLTLLGFDLLWMGQTTFRPMSFVTFWLFLLLSATLLALPALVSQRGWLNLFVLLFADLVMISNLMYCLTYFNAIPSRSYLLAGNLSDFGASVADSYRWYFSFLPFLAIAAFILYAYLCRSRRKPGDAAMTNRRKWRAYIATLGILALGVWIADLPYGGTRARMDTMRESPYEASCIVPLYTIPGFVAHDYFKTTEKLSPEDEKKVNDWMAFHSSFSSLNIPDASSAGKPQKRNLLLILCESLEAWPLEKTVEGIEITPYLNSLLKDSTTFYASKVVSQVGNGRSIDGQLLILAGMLPMKTQVYAYDAADNEFFTLPKAVKQGGGRAYLLTCDKPYVWNQARVAEAFGIDTILDAGSFRLNETVGPRRRLSDGSFMAQSVEKMRQGEIWPPGENVFMMWVTYSGHNPFNLPEKLRKVEFSGSYPEIIKNYMVTANYTDSSLSTLIEYLKTRPDWENTMVVITGDHEGLASDREAALSNPESARFVDAGQHTPLIILNSPVGGRREAPMGEVDIYPTLLALMGLDTYSWKGMGESVFNKDFPNVAIGSHDEINGDTLGLDKSRLEHLVKMREISDLILRFDLLRNK